VRLFQGNPWGTLSDSLSARLKRDWFQELSHMQKQTFKRIIQYRQTAIEQAGPHAVVESSSCTLPAMMLHEALEAVESRYGSHIMLEFTDGLIKRLPLPRSTSAPLSATHAMLIQWSKDRMATSDMDPFTTYCLIFVFLSLRIIEAGSSLLAFADQMNSYFSGGGGGPGASTATKNNLNKLFDSYREDVATSPDSVATDGSLQYFEEIGVDVEGMEVLAVLEVIQAPTMGEMNREGFVEGWSAVK